MGKKVTLKHIAEALGVSTMTVSRALNNRSNVDGKTRERILRKAENMGYTPNRVAKSLVSSKTQTIGVVIPEITHAFFPEVVRGIEEITYQTDYQLILTNANEQFDREKHAIQTLRSQQVDGILISSSLTEKDYSFYESILETGTRLVFFDRCIHGLGASCVHVNDRESSEAITNHLIEEHGYQKIAHFCGPRHVTIGKERYLGYKRALENHGIVINEDWIIESGFKEEGGYNAMQKLLDLPVSARPEAVVCVNDPAAFGAMEAATELGLKIPEDLAITGFSDEIRAPLVSAPLTTVHQPAYEVGKRAAEKLLKIIENEGEPAEDIEIEATLKIRRSCGC
ncbi:LacI family DNA-binding transcriptional regulator [Rhodohalobacter halophilus]|uniref:LacI family DNA-binding transcriptional regulator n=1 Tax=Rhodohalobacter halophilus TaxID=1812810 RepID=UPI000A0512DC|nr:LacI family DNA-binding transcriptional regulator [Rhodohalobacter halophilus]